MEFNAEMNHTKVFNSGIFSAGESFASSPFYHKLHSSPNQVLETGPKSPVIGRKEEKDGQAEFCNVLDSLPACVTRS